MEINVSDIFTVPLIMADVYISLNKIHNFTLRMIGLKGEILIAILCNHFTFYIGVSARVV